MAAVAIMTAMSAQAQSGYEDIKHEIGISYGALSNSTWMSMGEDLGTIMGSLGHVTYNDGSIFGALGVEYFYHVSPLIGVGAIATYTRETKVIFYRDVKCGEAENTYISLLPAVKIDWLRKKYFGMYSKAAVGVTLTSKKEDYTDDSSKDISEDNVDFNWQASLIGIEAGSPNLRCYFEFGVGEQGIFVGGVRFKF